MAINPIIPVWIMAIICVAALFIRRRNFWCYFRQILIILTLFTINLRIMLPEENAKTLKPESNVYALLVIDDTISMIASDYLDGNERLMGVRDVTREVVNSLPGAKFSVISFNNNANNVCPFTDNGEHVINVVDYIYPPESYYASGTSLNESHDAILSTLKMIKESHNAKVGLFFFSDGEVTDGSSLMSFSDIREYVDFGAVFGIGTTEGGTMKMKKFYDDEYEDILDYDTDYPYSPAVSKLDESNLMKIANDLSLDYYHVTDGTQTGPFINGIVAKVNNDVIYTEKEVSSTTMSKDTYYYFAYALFGLLVWEGVSQIFFNRRKRK